MEKGFISWVIENAFKYVKDKSAAKTRSWVSNAWTNNKARVIAHSINLQDASLSLSKCEGFRLPIKS